LLSAHKLILLIYDDNNMKGCCYMDPKINLPNLACYVLGLDLLLLLALTWPKEIKAESYRHALFGLVCRWASS